MHDHDYKSGVRITFTGILLNLFLFGIKLVGGIWGKSHALIADAVHTISDLFTDLLSLLGLKYLQKEKDEEHHYGHGKVENFSALVETLLLLVTCAWIIYEAFQRLFFKEVHVDASIWAFLIMAISIGIDISRSRALYRVARKYNSQALEADALHFSTDIWSSSVVIIGIWNGTA